MQKIEPVFILGLYLFSESMKLSLQNCSHTEKTFYCGVLMHWIFNFMYNLSLVFACRCVLIILKRVTHNEVFTTFLQDVDNKWPWNRTV